MGAIKVPLYFLRHYPCVTRINHAMRGPVDWIAYCYGFLNPSSVACPSQHWAIITRLRAPRDPCARESAPCWGPVLRQWSSVQCNKKCSLYRAFGIPVLIESAQGYALPSSRTLSGPTSLVRLYPDSCTSRQSVLSPV